MEKIEFLVGSEKRFAEFISKLNEKDKIAVISHSRDIDGIVSAKVVDFVIDANLQRIYLTKLPISVNSQIRQFTNKATQSSKLSTRVNLLNIKTLG